MGVIWLVKLKMYCTSSTITMAICHRDFWEWNFQQTQDMSTCRVHPTNFYLKVYVHSITSSCSCEKSNKWISAWTRQHRHGMVDEVQTTLGGNTFKNTLTHWLTVEYALTTQPPAITKHWFDRLLKQHNYIVTFIGFIVIRCMYLWKHKQGQKLTHRVYEALWDLRPQLLLNHDLPHLFERGVLWNHVIKWGANA